MNILDKIIDHKKIEVANAKEKVTIEELMKSDFFNRPTFSMKQFLLDETKTGIIAAVTSSPAGKFLSLTTQE